MLVPFAALARQQAITQPGVHHVVDIGFGYQLIAGQDVLEGKFFWKGEGNIINKFFEIEEIDNLPPHLWVRK